MNSSLYWWAYNGALGVIPIDGIFYLIDNDGNYLHDNDGKLAVLTKDITI